MQSNVVVASRGRTCNRMGESTANEKRLQNEIVEGKMNGRYWKMKCFEKEKHKQSALVMKRNIKIALLSEKNKNDLKDIP